MLNRHRNRSSPTEMLIELRWTSLEERRRYQRLTMLFKIRNGLVAIDANEYMTPINRPTRHYNTQAYLVPQSNLNVHQYSFFPRIIRDWNGLPQNIVDAPSVSVFRDRLARYNTEAWSCRLKSWFYCVLRAAHSTMHISEVSHFIPFFHNS